MKEPAGALIIRLPAELWNSEGGDFDMTIRTRGCLPKQDWHGPVRKEIPVAVVMDDGLTAVSTGHLPSSNFGGRAADHS